MARLTPLTARAVTVMSDTYRDAEQLFAATGGGIDAREQRLLDGLEASSRMVQMVDFRRRVTRWLEDTEDDVPSEIALPHAVIALAPWQQREWRELHPDDEPTAA
jgi:hypothetical protein